MVAAIIGAVAIVGGFFSFQNKDQINEKFEQAEFECAQAKLEWDLDQSQIEGRYKMGEVFGYDNKSDERHCWESPFFDGNQS